MSGTQLPVPEVLRLSFEAEQRVIRSSSGLEGIVTKIGGFLSPVDDQRSGVQVENQPPGRAWPDTHLGQEAIVELAQSGQGLWSHAQEKASQGRGIGIVRQSTQVLKHTVGLQQMRSLDPFETEDHRIDDGQQQFADAVAVVSLDQTNIHGHRFLETNSSQETMKQINASVMREASVAERDREFSWPFWHYNESYLSGSFHCNLQN